MEENITEKKKIITAKYAIEANSAKYTAEGTYAQIVAMRDIENEHGKISRGTLGAYVLIDGLNHLSQEDESWADEMTILGKNTYVSGDGTIVKNSKIVGCAVQGSTVVENSLIRSHVGKDKIRSTICGEGKILDSKIQGGRFNMKGKTYVENCVVIMDRDCSISLDGREKTAGLEQCVVNVYRTSLKIGANSEDVVMKPLKNGGFKFQPTNAALSIVGEEYASSLIEGVGSTLTAQFVDEKTAQKTKLRNGVRISPIREKENGRNKK